MNRGALIMVLGLAGFTVMADNWVVSPILPAIARGFGSPVTAAGAAITAYMLPFGVFQLAFGPLADRYGKRQVITLSIVFFTVATALCAVAGSLTGLIVFRALTGVFAASVMPVSLALIGDLVPLAERQTAIGTFMGISFLGQGLSMAIGGSIAYFLSWRGVFGAYSVLAVVSAVLLLTLGARIPSVKNPDSEFLAPYGRLLGRRSSLAIYAAVLAEGILIVGSFSYLGAYIEATYGFNYLTIGLIMTAFGAAAVAAGRASGRLAKRYGQRVVLLSGLTAAALSDLLLVAAGDALPALMIAVAGLGLGFMLAHSTFLTVATEFAAKARGAAMSLVAFCFMGGGGVGTAIGGKLIKAIGYDGFFLRYGLLLLALAVAAAFLVLGGQSKAAEEGRPVTQH